MGQLRCSCRHLPRHIHRSLCSSACTCSECQNMDLGRRWFTTLPRVGGSLHHCSNKQPSTSYCTMATQRRRHVLPVHRRHHRNAQRCDVASRRHHCQPRCTIEAPTSCAQRLRRTCCTREQAWRGQHASSSAHARHRRIQCNVELVLRRLYCHHDQPHIRCTRTSRCCCFSTSEQRVDCRRCICQTHLACAR